MSSEIEKHNIPTAVTVKPVLKLIAAHYQKDEYRFKEAALEIANELMLNNEEQLCEYILAQLGLVPTFTVTD